MSDCPSPECGVLCILIRDTISNSALEFFTLLSARKIIKKSALLYLTIFSARWYTEDYCHSTVKIARASDWYWFHYYFCDIEQKKWTLCAILYWTTMTILYLSCLILKFHVSSFPHKIWTSDFLVLYFTIFRGSQIIT